MNCGTSNSSQDHGYFLRFISGEEAGLAYFYDQWYKKLLSHGRRIVSDEFVVNSSIQEAFLKTWNFRERLTSALHTYRFLRLNVTWKCYNYYREPGRPHNCTLYTDNLESYADMFYLPEDIEQAFTLTEERLQSIYKVLPYLPATRQTIFTLYFKYGLSYKQIAKRFATSGPAIHHELQKGIEQLKKVIHTKKKLDNNCSTDVSNRAAVYPECLQLLQLFRLRYENKWSFETIAEQMNLPLPHVQQQYIAAHRLLNQMKKAG
jgi:RNA polymerase sigma factor (sigma-70 family)